MTPDDVISSKNVQAAQNSSISNVTVVGVVGHYTFTIPSWHMHHTYVQVYTHKHTVCIQINACSHNYISYANARVKHCAQYLN